MKRTLLILLVCFCIGYAFKRIQNSLPIRLSLGGGQVFAGKKSTAPFDPLSIHSEVEIRLLESLAQRRKDLEKREIEFQKKETALSFFEQEIQKKIKDLQSIRTILETSLKAVDELEEKKAKAMATVCQNMKSKAAARVLNQLDANEVSLLLPHINPRKASIIFSQMDPLKTKAIIQLSMQKHSFSH